MSNLMNALARLERAGSESSRCTAKLRGAATEVAYKIEESVRLAGAVGVKLPRGYMVVTIRSNVGSDEFLTCDAGHDDYGNIIEHWIDGTGGFLHGDFHAEIPGSTRAGTLQFAKDIAEGLLDEIAEFLEKRSAQDLSAASTL